MEERNNGQSGFSYTYSAKERSEIKRIREECKVTLQDKSMDEKLTLIVEAAANCGSMSALIALMQDKKSFSGAETMDDAVSNATPK